MNKNIYEYKPPSQVIELVTPRLFYLYREIYKKIHIDDSYCQYSILFYYIIGITLKALTQIIKKTTSSITTNPPTVKRSLGLFCKLSATGNPTAPATRTDNNTSLH